MRTQLTLHVSTPVRHSVALTKVAGTPIYLKLDSCQPTGSFKIRGIGHLCKTVSTFTQPENKFKGTVLDQFRCVCCSGS